jgi:hypothetical protein
MSVQAFIARTALACGVLGLAACQSGPKPVTTSLSLSLTMTGGPGRVEILNPGYSDIDIASVIGAEQQDATGKWLPIGPALYAGAVCNTEDSTPTVHLPARAIVVARPCTDSMPLGPGIFRYVVTIKPSGEHAIGPQFRN